MTTALPAMAATAINSEGLADAVIPRKATQRGRTKTSEVAALDNIELSIVIPTFNEIGNIGELLTRISIALAGVQWEAIVVDDDSPDETANAVLALAQADRRLRCLRRIGRRGLSSACLEGMAIASGRYLAVIDADLQHDESLLRGMLRKMRGGSLDLVVGSRYIGGGGVDSWHPGRHALSRLATVLTRSVLEVDLTDPMSGFFMIRSQVVRDCAHRLSGTGFKILMDIVASSASPLKVTELPYRFSARQCGESKLDSGVAIAFLRLLVDKAVERTGRRFGLFCLVGSTGVAVQLLVIDVLRERFGASFALAQTIAVVASMVGNFTLNNRLTYGDQRLTGNRFLTGLSRFAALCAVGAVVNIVVASTSDHLHGTRLVSVVAGIVAGALCNFASTSFLVWRREDRESS